MELVPMSPTSPPAHLDEWLTLQRGRHGEEMPGVDPPSAPEVRAELADDASMWRGGILARDTDGGVGFAEWFAPLCDNQDMAWFALYVDPRLRRRGVGSELLVAARETLAAAGRTRVASDVLIGGGGEPFATAVGARPTAVDLRSVLDVASVDRHDLCARAVSPDSYQLVHFRDRCPDELLEAFAVARGAMNDAPHGDMRFDDMAWDAARVRAQEARLTAYGLGSYVTAAIDDSSGAVAGFTELLTVGRPTTLLQDDTAVLSAHRGHGLGLAMKAANLRHALAHEPATRYLVTWNAESNRHMRAVNERLGFRVADRWRDLELVFAEAQTSSRSLL